MKTKYLKPSIPWLLGILVIVMSLTGTALLRKEYQNKSDKSTTTASVKAQPQKIVALGRIEPKSEIINLFPPLDLYGDRIKQILVQQGDQVTAGQIIATLASEDRLQAALAEAQEEVQVVQNKLEQIRAGAKNGDIIAQQAQINNLEAELKGQIATEQANINRWQSEVRTAKAEYNRYESLAQDGAISASERDNKRLVWETAQAQLESALASQ